MKRILLTGLSALTLAGASLAAQTKINGAGATFPNPIYTKWFSEYNKLHKDVEISSAGKCSRTSFLARS